MRIWVITSVVLATGGLVLASPSSGATVRARATAATMAAVAPTGHWSAPVTLLSDAQGATVGAVSCASARSCIAVGTKGGTVGYGVATRGSVARWSTPDVIDTDGGLNAASCVPGGPCLAGGKSASENGGTYRFAVSDGKWKNGPSAPVLLNAISCPSADFCGATGFLNYASAFIYNGTTWSSQVRISSDGTTISCPTATFCAVGSTAGDILYYQHGKWSKATSVDPGRELSSISCLGARFCAAVDYSGNALIDTNGHWSKPDYAHPLAAGSLTGVSCASAKFCVAVDLGGKAYFWDGSAWSAPQTISNAVAFSSVSCPDTTFCAAAGQGPLTSPTKAYAVSWLTSSARMLRSRLVHHPETLGFLPLFKGLPVPSSLKSIVNQGGTESI